MRQRGEVAKERTDAVHLMTQAELDVREMQDSMQSSKRTQVSGVCSGTARPRFAWRDWTGPGSGRCVPRCLPMMCCSRAAQPLLGPHRSKCQHTFAMGGTGNKVAHLCCAGSADAVPCGSRLAAGDVCSLLCQLPASLRCTSCPSPLQATCRDADGLQTSIPGPFAYWANSNWTPAVLAQADCAVPYSMCRLTGTGFTVTHTRAAPMRPDSRQGRCT